MSSKYFLYYIFLNSNCTLIFRRSSLYPNSDMAELTPSTMDVLINRDKGLAKMADNVNLRVSNLYENRLFKVANIISVDFIRGSRIVELALKFNDKKH